MIVLKENEVPVAAKLTIDEFIGGLKDVTSKGIIEYANGNEYCFFSLREDKIKYINEEGGSFIITPAKGTQVEDWYECDIE